MKVDACIIGGTGFGGLISAVPGQSVFVPTAYGLVKGKVVDHQGAKIYCLQRHSSGHKVPPHKVGYKAMASAAQFLGAKACLASAAVGSLKPEWNPGDMVLCSDLIDLSGRNLTMFDDSVEHRDVSHVFDVKLSGLIRKVAEEKNVPLEPGGIYVNMNGPRYETPAEIQAIGRVGGNLVGMTAASEAVMMAELNVPYACLAVVTNAAAGLESGGLSHLDVSSVMQGSAKQLWGLMLETAARIGSL